jgi:plasmid maintenance system antidote protein VapI
MLTTKRKPATVGEILVEEFMQPMGLTQAALAEAMGLQRKHVNELCNDRSAEPGSRRSWRSILCTPAPCG